MFHHRRRQQLDNKRRHGTTLLNSDPNAIEFVQDGDVVRLLHASNKDRIALARRQGSSNKRHVGGVWLRNDTFRNVNDNWTIRF